ncbi:alpha/beta fold hydrolase [Glycomyces arizonensis]|uniref:alpha/beta fold hydrolase n=1 Tax=Glycomyces arizonensis TaxID=256035 RepID=UPI000418423A|nr:alpha/beta hydrolase [Glycomyces arizonensis]
MFTTDSLTAPDGAAIGRLTTGTGPGLVIVHGGFESATSHGQLAEALAETCTVHLPDRRGRASSGPIPDGFGLGGETADLAALLRDTGAKAVFGVSTGGIIALEAALALPSVERVAVYEPPLAVGGSIDWSFADRFDREIADGRLASALATATRGTRMFGGGMPRWALAAVARLMLAAGDRRPDGTRVTLRELTPTFRQDIALVREAADRIDRYAALDVPVLLLGGAGSPGYLKTALDALERVLPHPERVEFDRLNHGGAANRNRGGRPELIAARLRRFLTGP